jgi:hypothetical protein
VTSTLRTAGCGPARPVVWEGPDGAKPVSPYPITRQVPWAPPKPRIRSREFASPLDSLFCNESRFQGTSRVLINTLPSEHASAAWGGDPEKLRFFGAGRRVPPRKGKP